MRAIKHFLVIAGSSAILAALMPLNANAQAYIRECAAALRPNQSSFRENKFSQSSYLAALKASQSSHKKQDGTLDVPGYFNGTYSSQDDAEAALSSYTRSDWTLDDHIGYLAAYVPKEGYESFNSCVRDVLREDGLHIEVISADEASVTFSLSFKGPDGVEGRYRILATSDGEAVTPIKAIWHQTDHQTVRIVKLDPDKRLHFNANVVGGPTRPKGDSATIPPFVRTTRKIVPRDLSFSDPAKASCGGNNDYHTHVTGPYGPPSVPTLSEDYFDSNPTVSYDQNDSWNGPGPVDPHFDWDVKTSKQIQLHTVCTVGSGLGDNQFTVRTRVNYVLNHVTYDTISPQPTHASLRERSITEVGSH